MNKLFISGLLILLLSGCESVTNEGVGTVTGGVVGGLIGSQFGGGAGQVAAAAGGAVIGAFLGGTIGKYMDRQDRMEVQNALETAPVGREISWRNPDTGNRYSVKPTRTYYHNDHPCREYVTYATIDGRAQHIYGKACRQSNGTWRAV